MDMSSFTIDEDYSLVSAVEKSYSNVEQVNNNIPVNLDAVWVELAVSIGKTETECSTRWNTLKENYTRFKLKGKYGAGCKSKSKNARTHLYDLYTRMCFLDEKPPEPESVPQSDTGAEDDSVRISDTIIETEVAPVGDIAPDVVSILEGSDANIYESAAIPSEIEDTAIDLSQENIAANIPSPTEAPSSPQDQEPLGRQSESECTDLREYNRDELIRKFLGQTD